FGDRPQFHLDLYAEARRIPWGETVTYGDLARALGQPGAARAVGQAMGRNPVPIIMPCHRVLASGSALRGFSAPGGIATKQRLLELERANAVERLPLFAPRP
ncbi:MAG: methylated-DNA--[protein]-cysteine S-methyltransferase, partial [Hyphomicrobiaceae bacterium]